jgi:hypothetical protein
LTDFQTINNRDITNRTQGILQQHSITNTNNQQGLNLPQNQNVDRNYENNINNETQYHYTNTPQVQYNTGNTSNGQTTNQTDQ